MIIKPGDRIVFTDDYKNYEGITMCKEYYRGIVQKILSHEILSITFNQMSFNGKDWFNTGNTWTTANINNIVQVI